MTGDPHDRPPRDFADFYRATAARTFDAARRMARGDDHVAHDATQEAYVVMWHRWAEWDTRTIAEAGRYAKGIAVRKVADSYRRRTHVALADYEPADVETGYDEILGRPLVRAAAELIDRQPVRRRAVAWLFFLDEFTCAEIAEALEITESTVRTHVERMRALMKPLVHRDSGEVGQP